MNIKIQIAVSKALGQAELFRTWYCIIFCMCRTQYYVPTGRESADITFQKSLLATHVRSLAASTMNFARHLNMIGSGRKQGKVQ